ncbi:TerC family protein [Extensimonas sp. H3M7-6]|uniref:TerC family protein n=1 Tax=Extensimonas soli TaxID=3031322 RepID=UPI0023D9BE22|nr:TerC family protein [Extensimonas sp. H3M7-6]MDF1482812.1 TerC family protein [Extensimonas sp. H3M7-6]
MESLQTAAFWLGLFKIVWINIILSGDNAVVIALAARTLPAPQQKKAVFWGSGAAVVLRIALTVVAARLLGLAYLQIVGGCLLLWIGLQLLRDEEAEGEDSAARSHSHLFGAIRTILIADLVMSLDNVIGVAAAAQGDLLLLALGLAVSIPLVIFGSSFMIRLMARFPMIVVLGAGLIGWVGGETIASDVALHDFSASHPALHYLAAALGAALVVGVGRLWQGRTPPPAGT